jgi:transcriptional regulator with XRE-family HTH domain
MAERVERGVKVPHLRAWRRSRGLRQDELAQQAGMAPSTVYRAESNRAIDIAKVRNLARVLNLTYEQLVRESPSDT